MEQPRRHESRQERPFRLSRAVRLDMFAACNLITGRHRDKGKIAGSIADAGGFGFYPKEQFTTGEGGVITTHEAELARLARSCATRGGFSTPVWGTIFGCRTSTATLGWPNLLAWSGS